MFWWNSMDTGRSRAGKNSQMKMAWVPRIQLWKEEKKYTFLLKTRWKKLYILMKHYKERSKACCLQFLFFFPPTKPWNFALLYTSLPNPQWPGSQEREHFVRKVVSSAALGCCSAPRSFWGWAHANAYRHKNSLPPWVTGTLLITAGGNGHHWENSLLCRTLICAKPANNYTGVSIFLYWTLCAHSSPWRFTLIYRTESSYYKKKKERKKINPFAYFDFVFVNFWTDGNIPQWKFYKNFHLLTECRPEIFPWWKSRVWVIKQALCYLPGIFTLQSEESESPSITVTTFFFPLHLGKWPIPSSQAQ